MFTKEVIHAGHTTRFSVTQSTGEGWELRVERDSRLVRRAHYTDWHRVERALSTLSREVGEVFLDGQETDERAER